MRGCIQMKQKRRCQNRFWRYVPELSNQSYCDLVNGQIILRVIKMFQVHRFMQKYIWATIRIRLTLKISFSIVHREDVSFHFAQFSLLGWASEGQP